VTGIHLTVEANQAYPATTMMLTKTIANSLRETLNFLSVGIGACGGGGAMIGCRGGAASGAATAFSSVTLLPQFLQKA